MKTLLLASLVLSLTSATFGQGAVVFADRIFTGSGLLYAPVYGVNPAAPWVRLGGNASTNGGTVDYAGCPLLIGTTFTASLWGAPSGNNLVPEDFQFLATTPFRFFNSTAGWWQTPANPVPIPFVTVDNTEILLQVRAWDSQNGNIPTWAAALADPTVPRGYSEAYSHPSPLPSPLECWAWARSSPPGSAAAGSPDGWLNYSKTLRRHSAPR